MTRWRRLSILAALVLAGCGGEVVYDLCPGSPCALEGMTADMFPGCAICRNGKWANEHRDNEGCVGLGYAHQCAAGLPSREAPSSCTFTSLVCK